MPNHHQVALAEIAQILIVHRIEGFAGRLMPFVEDIEIANLDAKSANNRQMLGRKLREKNKGRKTDITLNN
jgi:hypothetical protein